MEGKKQTTLAGGCATSTRLDYNDYVKNIAGSAEREEVLISARKAIDLGDELLVVGPSRKIKSPVRELIKYAISQNKIITYSH